MSDALEHGSGDEGNVADHSVSSSSSSPERVASPPQSPEHSQAPRHRVRISTKDPNCVTCGILIGGRRSYSTRVGRMCDTCGQFFNCNGVERPAEFHNRPTHFRDPLTDQRACNNCGDRINASKSGIYHGWLNDPDDQRKERKKLCQRCGVYRQRSGKSRPSRLWHTNLDIPAHGRLVKRRPGHRPLKATLPEASLPRASPPRATHPDLESTENPQLQDHGLALQEPPLREPPIQMSSRLRVPPHLQGHQLPLVAKS